MAGSPSPTGDTTEPTTAFDLRCPFCKGTIRATLGWEGRPYLQYQIVDGYECDNYECGAEWEPDGSVRHSGLRFRLLAEGSSDG